MVYKRHRNVLRLDPIFGSISYFLTVIFYKNVTFKVSLIINRTACSWVEPLAEWKSEIHLGNRTNGNERRKWSLFVNNPPSKSRPLKVSMPVSPLCYSGGGGARTLWMSFAFPVSCYQCQNNPLLCTELLMQSDFRECTSHLFYDFWLWL